MVINVVVVNAAVGYEWLVAGEKERHAEATMFFVIIHHTSILLFELLYQLISNHKARVCG